MENIIKELNLEKKDEYNLNTKFYMTLLLLKQEGEYRLNNTQKILDEFDIRLKKASQLKLAFLDSKILYNRLMFAKENNMLDKINKEPLILMEKDLFMTKTKEIKEELKNAEEQKENIGDILNLPQSKGLDEVTYEIYEETSTYFTQVLQLLNEEIDLDIEKVDDNIIKLITNDYKDIKEILLLAITHNNEYNVIEVAKIKSSIEEVMNYEKELKRVA